MMTEDERRQFIERLRDQDLKRQGVAVAQLALEGTLTIEEARDLLFAVLLDRMNMPFRYSRAP